MPAAPDPITSPPPHDWQPYNTSDGSGDAGGWAKVGDNPPGGSEDLFRTDYGSGPGPWQQT